jgi:hypothetical protein
MKQFKTGIFFFIFGLFFFSMKTIAQVKIGGNPAGPVHPSAVLHLDDSTRGLLLPVMTTAFRNAIPTPTNGLIIYNKTTNALNMYSSNSWITINTDTSEWKFDTASKRVYLTKGLLVGDSTYYDTISHKFNFTDRQTYTNSLGQDIPSDAFRGKHTFKATASKSSRDSITTASSALLAMYEIDNANVTYNDTYTGITAITTVNPKAFQKPSSVTGILNSALNAGNDTTFALMGINNSAYTNGIGYTDELYGIFNSPRISTASTGHIGTMFGIFNSSTRSAASPSRIKNNFYGYFGQLSSSLSTRIDGASYGIYLNNAAGAALGNYAIYTNAGRNRFGDSVLISNVGATVPRAFVDINNTTSMIIPTGATASRPVTGVTGMMRFNTDNGGLLETYNGAAWTGTIRSTIGIDIPLISAGTGYTASIAVAGATLGSSVSVSPTNALTDGLIISWSRVSAANTVEIRFNLLYGAAIDPVIQNFYVRVMQ